MFKSTLAARFGLAAVVAFTAAHSASADTHLTVAVKADRYSVKADKFTFTTRRPAAQIAETAVKPDANFNPSPLLCSKIGAMQMGPILSRYRRA